MLDISGLNSSGIKVITRPLDVQSYYPSTVVLDNPALDTVKKQCNCIELTQRPSHREGNIYTCGTALMVPHGIVNPTEIGYWVFLPCGPSTIVTTNDEWESIVGSQVRIIQAGDDVDFIMNKLHFLFKVKPSSN